ncbi:hypothetical protein VOLCADRAFT_104576 [Volvox carteri f. nagariensis]|uniref:Uncharacterized protein n=1 Tax=Volvox carteri f. nagariensis TaxID=3068 RepID=D8TUJ6_VOLCA|nr:uncharacterized protein VOLCADRAFT_104576 [Volvox carteri f. nagariensis]EFJ48720.1 hypothetical protein VOLCADRAFT_104576 [Volvox carteri f. nagariensis]|eukprot:XP_002950052.1 hypothetical protein VOLCADRAFT_104576 [Volvox carteri f. nagariensis]
MTGKRTKATGDNLVNAGAAEAAGEGGSGQMLPANQNDIEAARDTLSGNIDQPTLHQLLLGVLSAAQANAPKAPARDPQTAPPRDRSPDVVITKDVTIMPSAREQLAAIRTEVQANDAPKLTAPHEQREQLDEGTLMLLETAITALDANEPQLAVAGECLKIAHRRLKCYSVALAKAAPGANGNFTAPYEIWHGRRRNFTKPEFKPEAIDKGDIESALAKTRKSVAADRDENLAATVLGALLVAAGFRAPRPAQPPPAQRDNTQVETKNTAKRPAPGPAEPTRPRTKVARQAQEPHPDPGAPSRNEQAVTEGIRARAQTLLGQVPLDANPMIGNLALALASQAHKARASSTVAQYKEPWQEFLDWAELLHIRASDIYDIRPEIVAMYLMHIYQTAQADEVQNGPGGQRADHPDRARGGRGLPSGLDREAAGAW